jgi:signal transduction histidine kinase
MAAGEYDARAPASHLKEYDQFANQFNIMADRLGETIISLEADRSALRRFIADASHELRTPLTALKTFNQLLSDQVDLEDEPKATFIAESGVQIAQLDQLTSDLLNLSRLESRLSGTDFVLSDLRQPIERAVQANLPLSEEKNQEFEVQLPAEPLILSHDPSAIERAVSNIVANAVRYSPTKSKVGIRLSEDESAAYLTVSDNGPGIPEEEQPYIFDRFFRGRNHKIEGSGLGLSIAQEIAMIHGGEIRLQSEGGQGSTFTLELPKDLRS